MEAYRKSKYSVHFCKKLREILKQNKKAKSLHLVAY